MTRRVKHSYSQITTMRECFTLSQLQWARNPLLANHQEVEQHEDGNQPR
jgi:hypothetical protein